MAEHGFRKAGVVGSTPTIGFVHFDAGGFRVVSESARERCAGRRRRVSARTGAASRDGRDVPHGARASIRSSRWRAQPWSEIEMLRMPRDAHCPRAPTEWRWRGASGCAPARGVTWSHRADWFARASPARLARAARRARGVPRMTKSGRARAIQEQTQSNRSVRSPSLTFSGHVRLGGLTPRLHLGRASPTSALGVSV